MEDLGSDQLFEGFVDAVVNSRGVVSRDPRTGGDLERRLGDRYRQLARNAQTESQKLAEAFSSLAGHYEDYAHHEDVRAERDRLGR